jgi:hypothetical protein
MTVLETILNSKLAQVSEPKALLFHETQLDRNFNSAVCENNTQLLTLTNYCV